LPRQKQQLVKPCPKCGRNKGFVTLRKSTRPDYKKKVDYNGNKYLDYDDPIKKKLIQEPDPVEVILAEGDLSLVRSQLEIYREFGNLIPQIFKRYPQLFPSVSGYREAVTRMIDFIPKTLTPLSSPSFNSKHCLPDKRSIYGFDYRQWSEISVFSMRHSLRETAKKYGLSVNGMKRQMRAIEDFTDEIISCGPALHDFLSKSKMILSTDEELRSKFHANCDAIIKKSADECKSIIKRAALAANNLVNTPSDENMQKQAHSYQYYYIIHQNELSDNETRMIHPRRKRISCGPFTESKLPIELVQEYHNRHPRKGKNNPNVQNLQRFQTYLDAIGSFRNDYPKGLESLHGLCYLSLS
jgi:hypothetical protein